MDRSDRKPILIVQGGQYGSEAKGLVTHKLTEEREVDVAIRTGTVNAGHTVYHHGKAYAMQQLPVSWVREGCMLVIGPGAYVHPEILRREIEWILDANLPIWNRLFIDRNCGLHTERHTEEASAAGRHHLMGATGKGCSSAVIDKIYGRGMGYQNFASWLVEQCSWEENDPFWPKVHRCLADTAGLVNQLFDAGKQLLIEGTQGTMLDLHLGPYPFTTHKQTQAASWLAEAGLSPALPIDLWCVYRTFPIRVAGNSGPLPNELEWDDLAAHVNVGTRRGGLGNVVSEAALDEWRRTTLALANPRWPTHRLSQWTDLDREEWKRDASEFHRDVFAHLSQESKTEISKFFELTTVTKKLRRIADWDWDDFDRSLMLNRPHHIALTFMNYLYPEYWAFPRLPEDSRIDAFIEAIHQRTDASVGMLSFGKDIANTFMV